MLKLVYLEMLSIASKKVDFTQRVRHDESR